MYIVAIGWLFVIAMMAVVQHSWVTGIGMLVFYGLLPVMLILWLFGAPRRRLNRERADVPLEKVNQPEPAKSETPSDP